MEFSKKSERQSKQLKTSGNKGSGFSLEDNRKEVAQRKPNNTGLPDNLKSGIENMSGHSMDDVKVHYNSSKPAHYQAHAYAQGSQIHLASGQERHLPHEAWHVVQQKQGRVKPTMQMNGGAINDDPSLEKEADVMGGKAMQLKTTHTHKKGCACSSCSIQLKKRTNDTIQLKCLECRKSKGHATTCSKYKAPPKPEPKSDKELMKAAISKSGRMAKTHHEKTGVSGTPKDRTEEWKRENIKEVYERLKEGQSKRFGPDKKGGGGSSSGGSGGTAGAAAAS